MFHSVVAYKELSFKPVVSLCISTFHQTARMSIDELFSD